MGFRGRTKAERQVAIDGVRFRYHGAAYILYAIKRKYFYISIRVAPRICLFVPSIERYSGFFLFFCKGEKIMFVLSGRWRDLNLSRNRIIKQKSERNLKS